MKIKSPAKPETWAAAEYAPIAFDIIPGEGCPECGGGMQWFIYTCKDGSALYWAGCTDVHLARKPNGAPTVNIDHTYFYGSKHFVGRPGRRPKEWERKPKPSAVPSKSEPNPNPNEPGSEPEPEKEPTEPMKIDKDKADILAELLARLGGGKDDRVDGLIERVDKLESREGRIEAVKINDLPPVKLDGVVHKAMTRLLTLYAAGVRNFLLAGPGGSGKSTLTEQFAKALSHPFHETSLQGQTAIERIEGFTMIDGTYKETDLVKSLKAAGTTTIDEAFGGSPNTLIWFNAPLASRRIHTPGGTFERHPDHVLFFVDNTTGMGGNRTYTGRMKPDGATLDRFFTVFVDYDEAVERAATGCDDSMYKAVTKARKALADAKSPRIVGLRWLKRLVTIQAIEKCNPSKAIETIMGNDYEAWADDERRIVNNAI